tara:strand:+ start:246 stop:764 length:519 start_codon:yes stop_codon:yes gene_type:complete
MKRKGTILTREKALEFSSGVLTEEATGEADFHPLFKTGVEYEYARNPVKEIDITEAVKEAEEYRTQLNMGRKNKFSYWRHLNPESGASLSDTGLNYAGPMYQRKLGKPSDRSRRFNYEDLTEEQAEKELGRVLEGIKPRGTPWQNFFNWENKTDNLRSWIKVKKAQLYNKRK